MKRISIFQYISFILLMLNLGCGGSPPGSQPQSNTMGSTQPGTQTGTQTGTQMGTQTGPQSGTQTGTQTGTGSIPQGLPQGPQGKPQGPQGKPKGQSIIPQGQPQAAKKHVYLLCDGDLDFSRFGPLLRKDLQVRLTNKFEVHAQAFSKNEHFVDVKNQGGKVADEDVAAVILLIFSTTQADQGLGEWVKVLKELNGKYRSAVIVMKSGSLKKIKSELTDNVKKFADLISDKGLTDKMDDPNDQHQSWYRFNKPLTATDGVTYKATNSAFPILGSLGWDEIKQDTSRHPPVKYQAALPAKLGTDEVTNYALDLLVKQIEANN